MKTSGHLGEGGAFAPVEEVDLEIACGRSLAHAGAARRRLFKLVPCGPNAAASAAIERAQEKAHAALAEVASIIRKANNTCGLLETVLGILEPYVALEEADVSQDGGGLLLRMLDLVRPLVGVFTSYADMLDDAGKRFPLDDAPKRVRDLTSRLESAFARIERLTSGNMELAPGALAELEEAEAASRQAREARRERDSLDRGWVRD